MAQNQITITVPPPHLQKFQYTISEPLWLKYCDQTVLEVGGAAMAAQRTPEQNPLNIIIVGRHLASVSRLSNDNRDLWLRFYGRPSEFIWKELKECNKSCTSAPATTFPRQTPEVLHQTGQKKIFTILKISLDPIRGLRKLQQKRQQQP